jgi:hypothetical protein
MTWSLALKYGDLAVDGNGHSFAVVRDEAKLIQDLKAALLHRQGSDYTSPSYGSTLEGGVTPDGVQNLGFIGRTIDDMLLVEVEEEIRRVLVAHQQTQITRARDDEASYGRITLSRGEILLSVGDIVVEQSGDMLSINVYIQTGSGTITPVKFLFS